MIEILRYTQTNVNPSCVLRFAGCAENKHACKMSDIGKVIRELRKRKGMTLADLAHECGTDAGNISRLERGQQGYTEERLQAIAAALEVSVVDLWMLAALKSDELALLNAYRRMVEKKREALLEVLNAEGQTSWPLEDRRSGTERREQDAHVPNDRRKSKKRDRRVTFEGYHGSAGKRGGDADKKGQKGKK